MTTALMGILAAYRGLTEGNEGNFQLGIRCMYNMVGAICCTLTFAMREKIGKGQKTKDETQSTGVIIPLYRTC